MSSGEKVCMTVFNLIIVLISLAGAVMMVVLNFIHLGEISIYQEFVEVIDYRGTIIASIIVDIFTGLSLLFVVIGICICSCCWASIGLGIWSMTMIGSFVVDLILITAQSSSMCRSQAQSVTYYFYNYFGTTDYSIYVMKLFGFNMRNQTITAMEPKLYDLCLRYETPRLISFIFTCISWILYITGVFLLLESTLEDDCD